MMADPMMDFFDDSNLFIGGLEGLSDEGFAAGPMSLVDDLNLGAGYAPLQMEPLAAEKHPCLGPPSSSVPSHHDVPFEQQAVYYNGAKAPQPMGQMFPGSGNSCGSLPQHQYCSSSLQQAHQAHRLFPDSSPMWGNQSQNGNPYHCLPQQHQEQQHLNQYPHVQSSQHQTPAQALHHHGKVFVQHNQQHQQNQPAFFQGNPSQRQQQQQQTCPNLASRFNAEQNGSLFNHRGAANTFNQHKSYEDMHGALFSGGPEQQQNRMLGFQGDFMYPGPTPDVAQSFATLHSHPSCSVSSGAACSPSSFSPHVQPALKVGGPLPPTPATTAGQATPHSSMPESSGAGDAFSMLSGTDQHQQQQFSISLGGECPFQAMQAQGNYPESEMFTEGTGCLPGSANELHSNRQEHCESNLLPAACRNGFQALGQTLLPQAGAHTSVFEGLEAPDLLGDDLLPPLEPTLDQDTAFEQQHKSNCPWINHNQGKEELISLPQNFTAQEMWRRQWFNLSDKAGQMPSTHVTYTRHTKSLRTHFWKPAIVGERVSPLNDDSSPATQTSGRSSLESPVWLALLESGSTSAPPLRGTSLLFCS
ncbi:hypothetical protein JZ751_020970 [Albula glossodonta]|uniref:Chromodomain helicase DNA binding protein 9 n=1 Tax=Albula glossodonta TaxID=121402 RepID=A0A8T2PKV9_9TELE|nr:hypothetical protein JZ751_020970 [Albula glossodonta]